MQCGALYVQGKADFFFAAHVLFQCVNVLGRSMYNHSLMRLFIHSDLHPGWFLYKCNFSSSSIFTFDLCW